MVRVYMLLLFLIPFAAAAQPGETSISLYPQDYFRNPLGIPMLLAGNFGECRPNHFHSGIDIKTEGRENLPVYAAAEGYVSRIKMEKGGFGHALYLTHPNGFTTLYAHLNDFAPPIQKYVKRMQYQKESWALDLSLRPDQFPVKKGQQIAWSGNTGGSTAPHLHFEIRDTKTEHPLNVMLFGFPITDTRPPVPLELSFYDLNTSIYMQQAQFTRLKQAGGIYTTLADTVLVATDRLGVGVHVNDFMNASNNTLNFYTARWYLDGSHQGSITLDDIGYDETRYLHAYIDYKARKEKGDWFQLLFRLPGNWLTHLYTGLNPYQGAMPLSDGRAHEVFLELTDAHGNKAGIRFYVKARPEAMVQPMCADRFAVNRSNSFEHPNVRFELGEHALYDSICFQFKEKSDARAFSDRYELHSPPAPVHTWFKLQLKANKPVPFSLRDKIVLMYSDGKSEDGKAAEFDNGWYRASVRNFGTYWLLADTVAPVITPLQKPGNLSKTKQLRFRVKEDLTSVKSFRADLDGKWLCFEPRGDIFFYNFDEHCPPGKHVLKITVRDETNNIQTLVYNFTR